MSEKSNHSVIKVVSISKYESRELAQNSSILMQMVTTLGEDRSDSESTIITRIKFITFFLAG